ncbi:hypothetical protein TNCV_1491431 [Trichonephila clavipes]|nr:hypothetical protein TNCV_1491431 [Trichonephila clavipes]
MLAYKHVGSGCNPNPKLTPGKLTADPVSPLHLWWIPTTVYCERSIWKPSRVTLGCIPPSETAKFTPL